MTHARHDDPRDLVLTWPAARPLASYLAALAQACESGEVINYRVSFPPRVAAIRRVYMLHGGAVRGWSTYRETVYRRAGQVSDGTGGYWPEGWYIVRNADWHPIAPVPMRGFQGFRYLPEVSKCR